MEAQSSIRSFSVSSLLSIVSLKNISGIPSIEYLILVDTPT